MTKTILVTDLNEITNVKVSCKKCGYAMQLPLKVPSGLNVLNCPSCDESLPISHDKVRGFLSSLKSLRDSLKNNNFSNMLVEIETEQTK